MLSNADQTAKDNGIAAAKTHNRAVGRRHAARLWALQRFVLELDYLPTPKLWIPTIIAAAVLIGGLGLWNCRRVVQVAPAKVLREV